MPYHRDKRKLFCQTATSGYFVDLLCRSVNLKTCRGSIENGMRQRMVAFRDTPTALFAAISKPRNDYCIVINKTEKRYGNPVAHTVPFNGSQGIGGMDDRVKAVDKTIYRLVRAGDVALALQKAQSCFTVGNAVCARHDGVKTGFNIVAPNAPVAVEDEGINVMLIIIIAAAALVSIAIVILIIILIKRKKRK